MNRLTGLALFIAAPGLITAAEAQNSPIQNPVDAIAACRNIADSNARLTCFDEAAAALAVAREKKDVVVLDRAEVQKTRRSLFGFSLPKIRLFGGGDDGSDSAVEDIKEIAGTVTSAVQTTPSRWTVKLDDNTRWVTTEAPRGLPPRSGEAVVIKRGPLGSFDASFAKRRTIKVRRIE